MLVVAVVVATVVRVVGEPLRVVVELVLLVVLVAAGWVALTRTGPRRVIAAVVAVAVVVALIVSLVNADGFRRRLGPRSDRRARRRGGAGEVRAGHHGRRAQAERDRRHAGAGGHPRRAVHEPQVGGRQGRAVPPRGRVQASAGSEPVVLEPGMDWLQTVRDVAASGVDVLGMAGGDGSQAMVGTVAAELGLPMVVVPAGTRNHLALDLGLDRDDVVGALDALRGGRGAHDGPGRRERARVREQRVARAVRRHRALPRRTATPRWTRPWRPCRRSWDRTPSRSTSASPGPTAWSIAART